MYKEPRLCVHEWSNSYWKKCLWFVFFLCVKYVISKTFITQSTFSKSSKLKSRAESHHSVHWNPVILSIVFLDYWRKINSITCLFKTNICLWALFNSFLGVFYIANNAKVGWCVCQSVSESIKQFWMM